jgi:outer membrane protein OmpA-like peptidoglycan-associated protein
MIVKSSGTNTTVTLTDATKIEVKGGPLGIKKETLGATALIPGLQVQVQGTAGAKGVVTATLVKFSASALKQANAIQAGVTPTAEEAAATAKQAQLEQLEIDSSKAAIAANKAETDSLAKRFGQLGDYNILDQDTLYFAVNGTALTPTGEQGLKAFAAKAKKVNAYMLQVAGYTDASGNAKYNEELSERRAQVVTEYLQQQCNVPLYRVLAPAAMGFSHPVASNETPQGEAKNRRVVVSLVVNKGITGM